MSDAGTEDAQGKTKDPVLADDVNYSTPMRKTTDKSDHKKSGHTMVTREQFIVVANQMFDEIDKDKSNKLEKNEVKSFTAKTM